MPPSRSYRVTPAELKTLRQSLGLSAADVATAVGASLRTVRYWESLPHEPPADVASYLHGLRDHTLAVIDAIVTENTGQAPVTLLRYATAAQVLEHTGLDWPPTTHAIAMLRAVDELTRAGTQARMLWFDPAAYERWARATGNPHSPTTWADLQPDPTPFRPRRPRQSSPGPTWTAESSPLTHRV